MMAAAYWPRRYTMVGLCFFATFLCYLDRVNISVAIIPMARDFNWDREVQGLVLSSFFVGYLLTQVVGGRLADRYGGKAVLGFGVLMWSAFTIFIPPAAALGLAVLIMVRIGLGIGEGVSFPAVHSIFACWIPLRERGRSIALNFSGVPLGTVTALVVTPWIVIHWAWEWMFYLFGSLGLVWFVFWYLLAGSHPARHPTISQEEARYIAEHTGVGEQSRPTRWWKLLKHMPVWAIIVGHFCNNWALYVLLSWLPMFVTEGLGVDFEDVGVYSMIPHIAYFICLNLAGAITDGLLRRGMSVTAVRKLMQAIGFGGPAVALALVAQSSTAGTAIAMVTLGLGFGAFSMGGFASNHMDIAPKDAGLLMGMSNTAGTMPGILGVYISGLILAATESWTLVFYLAAAVNLVGLIFYQAFASGERIVD